MTSLIDHLPHQTPARLVGPCADEIDEPWQARACADEPASPAPAEPPALISLDLAAFASALSRRLRDAGVPVTPAQSAQYARSLELVKPASRRGLYCTTRAVFVTGQRQVVTFDRVFADIFGSAAASQ